MTEFKIQDADFAPLEGAVVVVTGGSSGIGLATIELLLAHGARVINGDLREPPSSHEALTFVRTDVTEWTDLTNLFKTAASISGPKGISHVFANAGIGLRSTYAAELQQDSNGKLVEPDSKCIDVNLKAVANTCALAIHFMRKQLSASDGGNFKNGSIVLTGSASGFQRFRGTDYCASKHGVFGLLRALVPNLCAQGLPIRVNAIAPSWTRTGLAPQEALDAVGVQGQSAEAVARSVGLLMADEGRMGEVIYSDQGRYWEIEETLLLPAGAKVGLPERENDDEVLAKLMALNAQAKAGAKGW